MKENLFYNAHVFICTNKKKDQRGCGSVEEASATLEELKTLTRTLNQQNNNKKLRISSSGCLGRCKEGPIAVLYPQGTWFHLNQTEEKQNLIEIIRETSQKDE